MEPTRQQIIDDLIRDAHESCVVDGQVVTSEATTAIAKALRSLEGSGAIWVGAFNESVFDDGVAKRYADWRRRYRIPTHTKKGAAVEVNAFGSVRSKADDGSVVYTQMRLIDMSLPQLRERKERVQTTRDTLSAEVRLLADLIEMMEADATLRTAGDALARLEAA